MNDFELVASATKPVQEKGEIRKFFYAIARRNINREAKKLAEKKRKEKMAQERLEKQARAREQQT